jgi:hypothetical protein
MHDLGATLLDLPTKDSGLGRHPLLPSHLCKLLLAQLGIRSGVADIFMPEPVLNDRDFHAVINHPIPAPMAKHMAMDREVKASDFASPRDNLAYRMRRQRIASLTLEDIGAGRPITLQLP